MERYYNTSDRSVLLFLKFLEHSGQRDGEEWSAIFSEERDEERTRTKREEERGG